VHLVLTTSRLLKSIQIDKNTSNSIVHTKTIKASYTSTIELPRFLRRNNETDKFKFLTVSTEDKYYVLRGCLCQIKRLVMAGAVASDTELTLPSVANVTSTNPLELPLVTDDGLVKRLIMNGAVSTLTTITLPSQVKFIGGVDDAPSGLRER
jgi:hypothetical protein